MTGSGLRATALIGRNTLIKTEKCPQLATQEEVTPAEREEEVLRGRRWHRREKNGSLKNIMCGGVGAYSANCVQLSG